jgi:hypothetical protein
MESAGLHELTARQRFLRLQFRPPPPAPPRAQSASAPETFEPTDEGSGIFGKWILDGAGLPAYEYTLDQYRDARAWYPNSENLDRRDHWHQVGNQRLTALASNDGTVQVYIGDRGGTFLNRFEAWQSDRAEQGLLTLLVRLALAVIRLIARLGKSPTSKAEPFAAPLNPRDSLPLEHVKNQPETSTSSLMRSYELLESQDAALEPERPELSKPNPRATEYAYAGGFSYIDDGETIWATAYRYRPQGAETRRVFGMGYLETHTAFRKIKVTRRVYAPYGDVPVLMVDTFIENQDEVGRDVQHYEYWDVNVQQLQVEWLRNGVLGAASDERRRALNRRFTNAITYHADTRSIVFRQSPPEDAPLPDQPASVNWHPAPIFLADLSEDPLVGHYLNKASFFGVGGAREPDTVRERRTEDAPFQLNSPLEPMPYCMVMRHQLSLLPGEIRTLRFVYGAGEPPAVLKQLAEHLKYETPFSDTTDDWKSRILYFWTGEDPVLQREMAWHSYNLLSSTVYNEFHKVHVVPQGSAYLFLHGADGVPRDQALFTLPMSYLDPDLAKDMLRLIMRITDGQSGQIPYSFTGHGYTSNALNVHSNPSDLDLFFLLAMTEYLSATRDFEFMEETVPFYPPGAPARTSETTVLDHIRLALEHLFADDGVGIGEHGLIRVRSGDWSDSIVLETAIRDGLFGVTYQNSKARGESMTNSQMALYVLPLLANMMRDGAPDIYALLTDGRVERLRAAVNQQWNRQGWFNRAILRGVTNQPITIEELTLEAQVWALISGCCDPIEREARLIERVEASLDRPCPVGAMLQPGGMVWPAISHLLTWGYTHSRHHELAWRSLNRNTFAIHSQQFPAVWFNTWSGPDGVDPHNPAFRGGTWSTPLTPMTDFPVMNANQDAMALLGLIRVCGIEPAPDGSGLIIRPSIPRKQWVLDTPLLRLEYSSDGKLKGEYRAHNRGFMNLYVYFPGRHIPEVKPLAFYGGERVAFEC